MRPFNLEDALKGKPVVTRDGKKVTDFFVIPEKYGLELSVLAFVDRKAGSFTIAGKFLGAIGDHPRDLFMAPEETCLFANYYGSYSSYSLYFVHATLEAANKNANEDRTAIIKLTLIDDVPVKYEILPPDCK